jgi:hypothetical protein
MSEQQADFALSPAEIEQFHKDGFIASSVQQIAASTERNGGPGTEAGAGRSTQ